MLIRRILLIISGDTQGSWRKRGFFLVSPSLHVNDSKYASLTSHNNSNKPLFFHCCQVTSLFFHIYLRYNDFAARAQQTFALTTNFHIKSTISVVPCTTEQYFKTGQCFSLHFPRCLRLRLDFTFKTVPLIRGQYIRQHTFHLYLVGSIGLVTGENILGKGWGGG